MSYLINQKKECIYNKRNFKIICKFDRSINYHYNERLYNESINIIYERYSKYGKKFPYDERTIIINEIVKLPSDIVNHIILPYIFSFKLSVIYYYIINQYNIKQYINPDDDIISLIQMFSNVLKLKRYETKFLTKLFFN